MKKLIAAIALTCAPVQAYAQVPENRQDLPPWLLETQTELYSVIDQGSLEAVKSYACPKTVDVSKLGAELMAEAFTKRDELDKAIAEEAAPGTIKRQWEGYKAAQFVSHQATAIEYALMSACSVAVKASEKRG